jgi:hypothetical protein
LFKKLYLDFLIKYYSEALSRNLFSHGFDFDKLSFFPAIPLMRPDALILSVRQGNNAVGKSQGLLLVGKKISEGSDVFAIFNDANHDHFILSPRRALAAIKRIPCSPRGELSPGGIERRSVPLDLVLGDGCHMTANDAGTHAN